MRITKKNEVAYENAICKLLYDLISEDDIISRKIFLFDIEIKYFNSVTKTFWLFIQSRSKATRYKMKRKLEKFLKQKLLKKEISDLDENCSGPYLINAESSAKLFGLCKLKGYL